ncbi:unnamed protein product [Mytilus edulis]|uniref:Uncharacterized protein n=1 Tax=Mytilus edulis TaxID=6550 RepID=A0A8S3SBB4_MYTED|nr:unnamed protein product [Mytilus edulis]
MADFTIKKGIIVFVSIKKAIAETVKTDCVMESTISPFAEIDSESVPSHDGEAKKDFLKRKRCHTISFLTNEYAVINPSNTLMDELTLFNEDSIPEHVLNLSTCTTLQNTSTYSDTQFPASQDLFSSAEEGLDGSCDLFSDFSATGNSECDKKRKFEISDESDSHSVSL